MRKTFIVLWAIILIATQAKGEAVTQEQAARIAQQLMVSKGKPGKKLSLKKSAPAFHSVATTENPAYYLYAGDSGFVVVAGDDVARPILGYSAEASLPEDGTLPPAMQEWLQSMEKQIVTAREKGIKQSQETARMWQVPTTGATVVQLTTAKWMQSWPFNKECPMDEGQNSITGCTATAYAILMRYYKYPQYGHGTTPAYYTATKGLYVPARDLNHEYHWDDMPLEYTDYNEAQGDAVALLMADVATAIQSDFSNNNTIGYLGKNEVFAYFSLSTGLQKNKDDFELGDWYAMVQSHLDAQRPLIYRGQNEGAESGHAFILDGYTDQNYYSVNWGWGGRGNGLFALDAMNIFEYAYNSGQAALFDCVPHEMLDNTVVVNEQEGCPTLNDAFALVAKDGSHTTIKLTENAKCSYLSIPAYANVTLDLNSHWVELPGKTINNYGTLNVLDTIYWCPGGICQTRGNVGIFSNYGNLTIDGGVYKNESEVQPEGNDYRRCVWSAEGSYTTIKEGTFVSPAQTLCFNGGASIDKGEFLSTGNFAVLYDYCTNDTLTVNGGVFTNNCGAPVDYDYRRCVWSVEGSYTTIKDGTFISPFQALCFNGGATIDKGEFQSTGNSAVLSDYCTTDALTINGGVFTNQCDAPGDRDYRRALWTTSGSNVVINGGNFNSYYQTLCFNGDFTINGGDYKNPNGNINLLVSDVVQNGVINDGKFNVNSSAEAIYNKGNLTINGCDIVNDGNGYCLYNTASLTVNGGKMRTQGAGIIYSYQPISTQFLGGIYSHQIAAKLMPSGYQCVDNPDSETYQLYPYMVSSTDGIADSVLPNINLSAPRFYDLGGKQHQRQQSGLNIIRKGNKTVKTVVRRTDN